MQMIAQEMPPPISQEFQRVLNETNVGRSLEDALKDVVARTQSYDFDLVVTAVLIQLSVGGNLADILESIGATIRERVQIMGEMRSLTVEGKLSGVILILLPIVLGIALSVANPTYMRVLIEDPLGKMMLGIGAMLQIAGGLVMRSMLKLDI
jgi:tight adherence protein B